MVVGITMVKDELDIAPFTVSRMLDQVDRVIVADNGSTDGTREMLDRMLCRDRDVLTVLSDPDPAYYQSQKMSRLVERAIEHGATWVVPFDADEVWKCRRGDLREAFASVPDDIDILTADLYDHVATALDAPIPPDPVQHPGAWGADPTQRIPWRRPHPGALPKVACRARRGVVIEQGNHGAHYAESGIPLRIGGLLSIRHFPYRSVEQMIRKARNGAAAYAATDLPEEVGAHWRGYGRLSDEEIGDVFRKWFWSADPQADGLVRDPA